MKLGLSLVVYSCCKVVYCAVNAKRSEVAQSLVGVKLSDCSVWNCIVQLK